MTKRKTKQEVIDILNNMDLHLVNEDFEYKNNKTKFEVECSHGHRYISSLDNFQKSKGCKYCHREELANAQKMDINYIREYLKSYNYTLLEDKYIRSDVPMKMLCDRGHVCYISWDNFKYGRRCRKCKYDKLSNKFSLNYSDVKSYIELKGFKLLSDEYINNTQKLLIECPNGHRFYRNYATFRITDNCPICGKSQGEKEISKVLDELNIKYIYDEPYFNDLLSPKGNPLRPDFILEDLKIWIEFDGEFHYDAIYDSDDHETLVIHDKIKDDYAKEHNWKLIRIPYWEINNIKTILEKELI